MNTLNVALKEWSILIDAPLAGEVDLCERRHPRIRQPVRARAQTLPPVPYVHPPGPADDQARLARPHHERPREPEKIELQGYAEAAKIFEVPDRPRMDKLFDLHIWENPLIDMRFAYRPEKPLYLVVVRAFHLAAPVVIANTLDYAGCRSWVPLEQPVDISNAAPALTSDTLAALLERITATFAH